ncbi:hypothetical protein, partial [Citrobacter sp. TBCS-15]|uniref:hypothetical protein n=1 Tax=Citrobacter sp. TBCS-15 TaxID=2576407 RepID=UPI001BAEA204
IRGTGADKVKFRIITKAGGGDYLLRFLPPLSYLSLKEPIAAIIIFTDNMVVGTVCGGTPPCGIQGVSAQHSPVAPTILLFGLILESGGNLPNTYIHFLCEQLY